MEKGLTIVPTKIYFNHGKVKVEIALARGKKSYDKRDQIAKDDTRRDIERMKRRDFDGKTP
jgi:SsrA-binding protein